MAGDRFVELDYDTANIVEALGSRTTKQCILSINTFGIETVTLTAINGTLQCRIWMQADSVIQLPRGLDLPNYRDVQFGGEILSNVVVLRLDIPREMERATEQVASMMNLIGVMLNLNARGEKPKESMLLRLEFQKDNLVIDRKTMRAAVDLVLRSDAVERLREQRSRIRVKGFVPNR